MPDYAQTATFIFAIGTLLLHVALLTSGIYRITARMWVPPFFESHVTRFGLWIAASFAVASLFLSLWYSEVVGLPVCVLCWLGRTMMYPLAIILPIAAWRGDRDIWRYALPLSLLGALVTGYQHLLQMGVVAGSACHAFANGGDCSARYVFEFGYITLPLFGFTVFVTIALLLWINRTEQTWLTRVRNTIRN